MTQHDAGCVTAISKRVLFMAVLLACMMYQGCGNTDAADREHRRAILITLDTTRADCIGVYGGTDTRTPNIDAFASGAVVFDRCISASNSTHPSHASIFTSLYMKDHGVDGNYTKLPDDPRVMARRYRDSGYSTAAFVSVNYLAEGSGFEQGFDEVFGLPEYPPEKGYIYKSAEQNNAEIFRWLESNLDEDFFIWLHYFDPHAPYNPPPPYNEMYKGKGRERISDEKVRGSVGLLSGWLMQYLDESRDVQYYRNRYKGEVSYLDHHLGRLFEEMKELGIFDGSIVVMMADHGESLGEDGVYFEHNYTLNDATVHVPLIIKLANGAASGRRGQLVSSVDVYPTLLGLCGIEVDGPIRGRSLEEAVFEPDADAVRSEVYTEGVYGAQVAVRTPARTYIRTLKYPVEGSENVLRPEYLYDNTPEGPAGITPVGDEVREYNGKITAYMEEEKISTASPGRLTDKKSIESLKTLGYL